MRILANKRYHHFNVRLCGQACTSCVPHHLKENATNRTKGQCPLIYLSATSIEITGIEDKRKRIKKKIFQIGGYGMFLQHGITCSS
jgi:hypothetical protein